MKKIINEIGDTPKGQYALGQVSARALDRAFSKPKKETNGMVAGNPKYGKVSQDACYAAARGQDDMAKKRGYKRIVDVPDDERHEIGSYFHKGSDDYRQKHTVKLSESQLRGIIAESVRKVLSERYLEPGTADYETDKIAKDLKRSYPQYESFVDEYVYGGYYEQYARMSGYIGVREGFREFVKKKQHGNIAEGVKKVLKENWTKDVEELMDECATMNNMLNDLAYFCKDETILKAMDSFRPHLDELWEAVGKYVTETLGRSV